MVLIAAAVCSKAGKPLISRQFVEMTKSRNGQLRFSKVYLTNVNHLVYFSLKI